MVYRLFSFFNFWVTATNQHGVHSPFVYKFVTKCLYSLPSYKTNKSLNILLKTIVYFKKNNIQLVSDDADLFKTIKKNVRDIEQCSPSSEILYLENLDNDTITHFIVKNNALNNNSIVYVHNLYKNKATYNHWKNIKDLENVRVTIDMFYGGLVFFRREQVKEHFKIRI